MPDSKGNEPFFLTILTAGVLTATLFIFQPYSADSTGRAYARPARAYIKAALSQDSMMLTRLSVSNIAVEWALRASRTRSESLALWAGRTSAWTGWRWGDTTEVLLYPPGETCSNAPIVFRFLGSGSDARVVSASSSCLDPS
jgi:hypothetical protein